MEIENAFRGKRMLSLAVVLLLPFLLFGCAAGLLSGAVFTWVTIPLTQDLDQTPMVEVEDFSGRLIQIKEPFSGYGFYAEVDSNGIGDIARKHKLRTVYFADKEIFSIMGIWKTETVTVYGE